MYDDDVEIKTVQDEQMLERLQSLIDGELQELVVTDQAVYFQRRRTSTSMSILVQLLSLLSILGLGMGYQLLKSGQEYVRHTLDHIDCVTTRRVPLPWIPQIGAFFAVLFGINVWLQFRETNEWSPWLGYGVSVFVCLIVSWVMLRFQRSCLSIRSLNNELVFSSYRSYRELVEIQEAIWRARHSLFLRRTAAELALKNSESTDK